MLRDYQQRCFDEAKAWLENSLESCLIEAATGAGKSHIIAALADWLDGKTDKKILCLAPSKELIEQNHKKFLATGNPASIYSASISKSLRHSVVFASPKTVHNSIDFFKGKFAAVIIDEAHGITPTIKDVVAHLKADHKSLRVIGLTATPYRLGTGYIYEYDQCGDPVPEHEGRNQYFNRLLCRVTARELIDQGYLTPPTTASHEAASYDTSGLEVNSMGKFTAASVEQAFEGHGRKTSKIVSEIVSVCQNRKGVIIFAASIAHAAEVLASLPPGISASISGGTSKRERERIISRFKQKQIKYLVNVAVLTTGFDAPHVDVVCLLRATESVGLLQQMIGRGLRIDDGKKDCLVLDYAENIERHCPDGDIFNPKIRALPKKEGELIIHANCPYCGTKNEFSGRPNPDEFAISKDGYFMDLLGEKMETPAHFGRRCLGQTIVSGESVRCSYRWNGKECPECGHHNDIAARFCEQCKEELVDPNEKLRLEFAKIKSDPYSLSTDEVLSWNCSKHISAAGNETLRIDYVTECRRFSTWYLPRKQRDWSNLCAEVFGKTAPDVDTFLQYCNSHGRMPRTVTVKRDKGSKFYSIYDYGRKADVMPK